MWFWIILGVYLFIALCIWPMLARFFHRDDPKLSGPACVGLGLFWSIAWPGFFGIIGGMYLFGYLLPVLFGLDK